MPTVLSRKSVNLTEEQSRIVNGFLDKFPTEADCIEEICKFTAPKKCMHCGSDELVRVYGSRVSYCRNCRGKNYCTSHSFFFRCKKIQAMLACIYFFQAGFCIPSTKLSEIFDITIATAQKIIKKISHVLKEQMKFELPKIASSSFLQLFTKRSTETPARKHPRYEQKVLDDELREEEPGDEDLDDPSRSGHKEHSRADEAQNKASSLIAESDLSVFNFIQDDPVSFDELLGLNLKSASELSSLLGILEIEGLIKSLPGDKYVRFKPSNDEIFFVNLTNDAEAQENIDQISFIVQFLMANFGGCSRKYLDLFLAMFWCQRDKARWCEGQVLRACLDYGYISFKSIYASVTPLITNYCPF